MPGYWNAHSDLDWYADHEPEPEPEDWVNMLDDPNEEIVEQADEAEPALGERQCIIETIRNDPALWGYLCGAIGPADASTGTLRAALRLVAEWLEEQP